MTDVIDADYTPAPLAVREEAGIMPAISPAEAQAQMRAYQELCAAVLTADDYQEFTEKKKVNGRYESITKRFKKKSAVKKLQTYFGISVDVVDDSIRRDDIGEGHFGFRCKAIATSPGGRTVAALGGCATTEERFEVRQYDDESDAKFAARQKKALARAYHDVLSTAETRATNRAVMNLVSPGEVTAEEISRPPRNAPPAEPPRDGRITPTEITAAEADEIRAMCKARGLKIVAFIATVVPGFDKRENKTLNVAEYAMVKAALESMPLKIRAKLPESPYIVDDANNPLLQPMPAAAPDDDRKVTPRTNGRLFALLDERLSTEKEARLIFAAEHGVVTDSFSRISEAQARHLIAQLELLPNPSDLLDAYAREKGIVV